MPQNIYDDPDFFAGYSQLARSRKGLAAAPEWPAIQAVLPPLAGRAVVDLGCGFGWFCRWARQQGAASVLGLDLSERMLDRARTGTDDPAIAYRRADLNRPALPEAAFDLAYSSLVLHYLEDLPALLAALRRALRPGGHFVFTAEHPVFTAPSRPGWVRDAEGRDTWPVDGYLREGPRVTDWLAPGVVKQHRTLGTLLTLLIRAGFTLRHVEEWGPAEAQVAAQPELAAERERPAFLLVAATA
ncbi:class I SAM-dependent methyltransferase [Teichococcus oryzae]|uniref:Class I SAM-dependent methyltransferase n=1 Tax=Teichococcus oryzae TaxID=1608942 RepID=A0A5B2TG43_9PROT|nr:class I SAM-dependent methyltransferase [Pseudoroseomonas oryzae]KAA2213149.1 class I SAM-dependent methyltransferase [Pseudoroseomonas oryzae]